MPADPSSIDGEFMFAAIVHLGVLVHLYIGMVWFLAIALQEWVDRQERRYGTKPAWATYPGETRYKKVVLAEHGGSSSEISQSEQTDDEEDNGDRGLGAGRCEW